MPLAVREPNDLVLDRGAVARADAVDLPGEQGRAVEVLADNAVGFGRGIPQVAGNLLLLQPVRQEGERDDPLVAGLLLELGEVDGAAVDARRRAGLEPAQREAEPLQRAGEGLGVAQARGAGIRVRLAHDDAALEVHARGDDGRRAGVERAGGGPHAGDPAAGRLDGLDLALAQRQALLVLQGVEHAPLVLLLVGLGAQGVHGRALARVEHAGLQKRIVDGAAHLAAQGVDLADQVPLCRAPDGGIAGHERHAVHVEGEQERPVPHAGAGERRLAARVPRAHHDDLIAFQGKRHRPLTFQGRTFQRCGRSRPPSRTRR